MDIKDINFPKFKKPPVVETVFSVQFKPLDKFRTPHLGLLFSLFRKNGFIEFEEKEPLPKQIETFNRNETTSFSFRISEKIPVPRCWFVQENKEKMIQIQQDRFIFNWRKQKDPYPNFENNLEEFNRMYNDFTSFIKRENIGDIIVEQCEIQYVNHITQSDVWINFNELHKVVEFCKLPDKTNVIDDLLTPEQVHSYLTYVLKDENAKPWARLHVITDPGRKDGKPIFNLRLIVRGKPKGNLIKQIDEFFENGREWIVKSFVSLTKDEMQIKDWEIES